MNPGALAEEMLRAIATGRGNSASLRSAFAIAFPFMLDNLATKRKSRPCETRKDLLK